MRKLNKGRNRFDWKEIEVEYTLDEPTKEVPIEEQPNVCQSCKRSILKIVDLGIKTIETCEICGFRSKPISK